MKKIILILFFIAAAGLLWLVWRPASRHEEEEAKAAAEVPVHLGKITRATLRAYVTAYGTVEPEPAGAAPAASARLGPSMAGLVAEVKCVEGQLVEKGALLFQLDSRAADVTVEKTRKAAEFADKNYERQKKLMQADGTSQKLLLEAEQGLTNARNDLNAAQTQQALLRVTAPLAGTVARIHVKPGEAVDLATVLAEVIDLGRLVVSVNVPSAELSSLKPGQPVQVLAHKSSEPVHGSISFIGPQVDAKTGTALVRATVPASSGLRPGQFIFLRITCEERQDCLAAPVDSVVKDSEGGTVISIVHNSQAVQKPVKAGLRDGELIEIEGEGLQAGMTVVTQGAYALPKETKIRVMDN